MANQRPQERVSTLSSAQPGWRKSGRQLGDELVKIRERVPRITATSPTVKDLSEIVNTNRCCVQSKYPVGRPQLEEGVGVV
jgi:hypothetical protein